jgi:hypothetical protein
MHGRSLTLNEGLPNPLLMKYYACLLKNLLNNAHSFRMMEFGFKTACQRKKPELGKSSFRIHLLTKCLFKCILILLFVGPLGRLCSLYSEFKTVGLVLQAMIYEALITLGPIVTFS